MQAAEARKASTNGAAHAAGEAPLVLAFLASAACTGRFLSGQGPHNSPS